MENAQFVDDEFISAASLNAATQFAANSAAQVVSGSLEPGLIRSDVVGYSVSGLSITVTMPVPFQVAFANGAMAAAHGTTDGVDTNSFSLNFSTLVPPGTGSVTAYCLAQQQSIQLNPFAVTGPPQGHPDFNPQFQPYTAYGARVDSVLLTAGTAAPDNQTTFELFRAVLTSGSTTFTVNTEYQQPAASNNNLPIYQDTSVTTIPVTLSGKHVQLLGTGPYTLPPVSGANGLVYTFSNATSTTVVVGTDQTPTIPDQIYGTEPWPYIGQPAFYVEPGQYVRIVGADGLWQIIGGDPLMAIVIPGMWTRNAASSGVFTVGSDCPPNVQYLSVEQVAGGGGGSSIYVSGGTTYTGGGGGAGEYAEDIVTVFNGQTINWAVGAGGSGSTSGVQGTGGTGGASSFGTCNTQGGIGGNVYQFLSGVFSSVGGDGGTGGTGGIYHEPGGNGGDGIGGEINPPATGDALFYLLALGHGGGSFFGGGPHSQAGTGSTISNPGPAGTGGAGIHGPTASPGVRGQDGRIVVRWGI